LNTGKTVLTDEVTIVVCRLQTVPLAFAMHVYIGEGITVGREMHRRRPP